MGSRRLPTEAEWEKAARHDPATERSRRYPWGEDSPGPEHANLDQRHLQPAPIGSYPAGESPYGVRQLIGDVWEWTASDFLPYPGFKAWPYEEYGNLLRGGMQGAARRFVCGRTGRLPGRLPQLGLPDPATDLLRFPHRPGHCLMHRHLVKPAASIHNQTVGWTHHPDSTDTTGELRELVVGVSRSGSSGRRLGGLGATGTGR